MAESIRRAKSKICLVVRCEKQRWYQFVGESSFVLEKPFFKNKFEDARHSSCCSSSMDNLKQNIFFSSRTVLYSIVEAASKLSYNETHVCCGFRADVFVGIILVCSNRQQKQIGNETILPTELPVFRSLSKKLNC